MIEFRCPLTQKMWEYWLSLPREGLIPKNTDFLPEHVPDLLPYINIYELVSKDLIRFKLSGTKMTARDGFDRTGDNYLDMVAESRRKKASEAFWVVHQQPSAMRVIFETPQTSGVVKTSECIGLPMQNSRSGPPVLYYLSQEIPGSSPKFNLEQDRTAGINVLQRDFIDIGAGIPDFKD